MFPPLFNPCFFMFSVFAPLTDIVESLTPEQREKWERLWQVSDSRMENIHPLIYAHPVTGKPVRLALRYGVLCYIS